MNRTKILLVVGLLAALPLSGCIENMQDLKDRLGAEEETAQPASVAEEETPTTPPVTNVTAKPLKAPVARVTVFGANGALVYKSSFKADDPTEPVFVKAPVKLQLLGTDSEALEPGAKISDYSWVFAGMTMTGGKVEHELTEPGAYPLNLTVKDSKGSLDWHNLTIQITPEPFTVVEELQTSGPIIGVAEGTSVQPASGSLTYTLALTIDDKPHKATSLQFVTKGGQTCDPIITVTAPDGTVTGPQDSGAQETVSYTDAAEGAYEILIEGYSCVAPEGIPIEVTVTYVQIVEGLAEGGDGHGGHAH